MELAPGAPLAVAVTEIHHLAAGAAVELLPSGNTRDTHTGRERARRGGDKPSARQWCEGVYN